MATQLMLSHSLFDAPTESRPTGEATGAASIIEGDAFDLVQRLPSSSIDLIITSPPYWGLRTYGGDHNWEIAGLWESASHEPGATPPYAWYRDNGGLLGLEPFPEWYVAHLVEFFDLANASLKKHGSIWANIGDTYFARWSSIRDNGRQGLGGHPRERRRVPMGGYRQEKQLLLIPVATFRQMS